MYRGMKNAFGGWFTKTSTRTPRPADPRTPLNVLCFYVFGMTTFFNQEMLLPAAEDILSGKRLPTATILVAIVAPLMITKMTVPWLVERVSYAVKICAIALSMTTGLVLVGAFEDIRVKLLGIALNAVATGAAEVVFLALSSFYSDVCISAYVAGTGMASLFSPAYYTGLTTWSCISPKTAILITTPLPFLSVLFYTMLDKEHTKESEIKYTRVDSTTEADSDVQKKFSCSEKLRIALKISPFIIALCLSFFSEYLSMSSVVTTIAFPSSGIDLRDHFIYYTLSYGVGKFIGRSHLFLLSFLPLDDIEFLKCSRTWIFTVLETAHLVFLLLESCFHFVPFIWIIILLCSSIGLLAGMIVVHSPHAAGRRVTPEEREFALGLLTIGNGVGSFLAGLAGLIVEPFLEKGCIRHFPNHQEFCFTRSENTTGWTNNIHCY